MRETCRSDDLCKTHLCTQPPPLPWANQSLPAGEVLLVLGQGLLLDAAERSCAWGRMQKPDSLAGIYLVEARVHVGGRDEEVLQAPSVRAGWKNFPSKLLGKVPAHIFTTEVKPVVAFLKQALACPLAIGQKVLAVFPAPGGLTWELQKSRMFKNTTGAICLEGELSLCCSWVIPAVGRDSKNVTLGWKEFDMRMAESTRSLRFSVHSWQWPCGVRANHAFVLRNASLRQKSGSMQNSGCYASVWKGVQFKTDALSIRRSEEWIVVQIGERGSECPNNSEFLYKVWEINWRGFK